MDLEAWNRCVLMAMGLFAVFLYFGLIYAGLAEFYLTYTEERQEQKAFSGSGHGSQITQP